MEHQYVHTYGRVRLQPLVKEEIEKTRILRNKTRNGFIDARIIAPEEQEAWFCGYLENPSELMFSVYLLRTEEWIGTAALISIDPAHASAEYARLMIDKAAVHENGLGYDTNMAIRGVCFDILGFKRLHLSVYEDNIPVIKNYLKAGITVCGRTEDSTGRQMLLMEETRN